MNTLKSIAVKAKTFGLLLWSKGAAIAILVVLMMVYNSIPDDKPTPYAGLLFAVILAWGTVVLFALLRIAFFPEVSEDAESGKIRGVLEEGKFTPKLVHYWFATALTAYIALKCVSSLLS